MDIENMRRAFQRGEVYKPYIQSIVFPNYKNLMPGSEITFDFPLTLLVGRNGTNKSSLLHALYGCPAGKSTGEFWFSMHTDPIKEDRNNRPAYFYRYHAPEGRSSSEMAEVLKTMIRRRGDPNYWEPSRPVADYGMKPLQEIKRDEPLPEGRTRTRWDPITKNIVYLDCRRELSAFDKSFYAAKEEGAGSRPQYRSRMRHRSKHLKEAIENNSSSYIWHKKERIVENYTYTSDEVMAVNHILGNEYAKITYIEHDFYLSGGFSVYLRRNEGSQYSEAFAGSGETSVVRLVYALEKAPDKSLILLDEPETSLHIEAQARLQEFILEKIHLKKLQVVISTHSPFFAKGLPDYAIKVLRIDDSPGHVQIINSATAEESTFYLGYQRKDEQKVPVYVEDRLSKAVCEHVLSIKSQEDTRDLINILPWVGGEGELLSLAATEAMKDSSNVTFFFDGDCRLRDHIPDPEQIVTSKLEDEIKKTFKFCPKLLREAQEPEQVIENLKKFLQFARNQFEYFPFTNPEDFLVQESPALREYKNDDRSGKEILRDHTEQKIRSMGRVRSDEIFFKAKECLADVDEGNEHFEKISEILRKFSTRAPSI